MVLDSTEEPSGPASGLSEEDEDAEVIWTGHPSYLVYILYYIFGVVFVVVSFLYPFFAIWGGVLGASFILVAVLDRNSKLYAITSSKIMARAHIHRYSDEMKIEDITSVHMHQGPVEKLFGLGTVRVVLVIPAEDEEDSDIAVDISFKGIRRPQQIMAQIEELKSSA